MSNSRIDRFWPGFISGGVAGIIAGVIITKKISPKIMALFADEYMHQKVATVQHKVAGGMSTIAQKAGHLKDGVSTQAHKVGHNIAGGAEKFRKGAKAVGELMAHHGEEAATKTQ